MDRESFVGQITSCSLAGTFAVNHANFLYTLTHIKQYPPAELKNNDLFDEVIANASVSATQSIMKLASGYKKDPNDEKEKTPREICQSICHTVFFCHIEENSCDITSKSYQSSLDYIQAKVEELRVERAKGECKVISLAG